MSKPSDYEYRSEQDPGDARINQLAAEDWEHYLSDRGKVFFRRLKHPDGQRTQAEHPRDYFGANPQGGKKSK